MEDPKESLKVCQSLLELYAGTDFSSLEDPTQGAEALRLVRAKITELEEQIKQQLLEAELERRENRSKFFQEPEAKATEVGGEAVIEAPSDVEPADGPSP